MRIVLLGPPGAGKGSLASLLAKRLGIAHLSTGEIFRQEIARGSLLGRRVQSYVASGRLVPDALVIQVMAQRLNAKRRTRGFVLDGFPRTHGQAVGLDQALKRQGVSIDGAIYLGCSVSLLLRRLSGRRVCPQCGTIFHIRTMRPRRPGRCDQCQARLVIRKDDQPDMIRRRLNIDGAASRPLVSYYRKRGLLSRLDGSASVETVFGRMLKQIQRQGWLITRSKDD